MRTVFFCFYRGESGICLNHHMVSICSCSCQLWPTRKGSRDQVGKRPNCFNHFHLHLLASPNPWPPLAQERLASGIHSWTAEHPIKMWHINDSKATKAGIGEQSCHAVLPSCLLLTLFFRGAVSSLMRAL